MARRRSRLALALLALATGLMGVGFFVGLGKLLASGERDDAPRESLDELKARGLGRVRGVARDRLGRPVAGLVVEAHSKPGRRQVALAITNESGAYVLLLPTGSYDVLERSELLHTRGSAEVTAGSDQTVDFTSEPLSTLWGVLRGSGGQGVPGQVHVVTKSRLIPGDEGTTAATDSSGRFSVPFLMGDGSRVVEVDAPGFGWRNVPVALVDQRELVIDLLPEASITGRVVDASGKPVEARIEVQQGERWFEGAQGQADGRFEVAHQRLAPGPTELRVTSDHQGALVDVNLVAGATRTVEVELHELATLEVKVRDEDGDTPNTPVDVAIERTSSRWGACRDSASVVEGEPGLFRAEGMFEGPCLIRVVHGGESGNSDLLPLWSRSIEIKPGKIVVDAVLPKGVKVAGRVVLSEVAPEGRGMFLSVDGVFLSASTQVPGEHGSAPIAADGSFAFEDVPECELSLRVHFWRENLVASRCVHVERGKPLDSIVLEPQRAATLEGVVRAPDGSPLAGLKLEIQRAGQAPERRPLVTEIDGRFERKLLDEGDYTLTLLNPELLDDQTKPKKCTLAPAKVHLASGSKKPIELRATPD